MKFKHIILDLDGTLIEETRVLEAQAAAVASVFGTGHDRVQEIIYAFFAANNRAVAEGGEHKNNLATYMRWMGESLSVNVDEADASKLASAWTAAYENSSNTPTLFPDTISFLEEVIAYGYTPILASGGEEIEKRARLEAADLEKYFPRIFAANEVGFQKQNVRFWEEILTLLKAEPESVLVVGNQLNDDIQGPNELGITTVLIKRPDVFQKVKDPEGVHPTKTVANLNEILEVL